VLVEDTCTVDYEDDHKLIHFKLLCVNDDEPVMETLVNQLNQDWVKEKLNVLEVEVLMKMGSLVDKQTFIVCLESRGLRTRT